MDVFKYIFESVAKTNLPKVESWEGLYKAVKLRTIE